MNRPLRWLPAAIAAVLLIWGCTNKAEVRVPPPPEVIVSHPLQKEATRYLEFTGITSALESVEIRARVEGWLQSVDFVPGSNVKKGALLFVIDPKPFQAQVNQYEASLKGKQAELQLKKVNLKRAQQLLATASISQLQFDQRRAEEQVGEAQVGIVQADLDKANLNLGYTKVTAPITGQVSRNYVDVGNLVGAGTNTKLAEIVNATSLYVYFDVSERDVLMLNRMFHDQAVEKKKPRAYLQLADETGYPHTGYIDYAEPKIDPNTGTLKARAVFPNVKSLLVPGLFGRIRVPIEKKQALLVPEVAVGISQAGRYVLVVNKDHVVEERLVKTGQAEHSLRVIEDGLKKDDWVVVNGIQRARPGAKVSTKESSISEKPKASEGSNSPSGKQ
jgi:membrane fusion protein, multidrug efflux system